MAGRFLEPYQREPDEKEVAEKVRELLLQQQGSLAKLVGPATYAKGVGEVYEMLQSQTFVHQVGFHILEITVLAMFPEAAATLMAFKDSVG